MGLRNFITAAAVTGLGLALAAPAGAQEVTVREDTTLELQLGGELSMGYVYRGEMFEAVFPRNTAVTGRATPKAEVYTDLRTALFLDFTLKDAVGALIELTTSADPYAGEKHRFGDNAQDVEFEQVKVYAQDVFLDRFEIAVGVQRLAAEFRKTRGHGQFFLDIANSENPFTGAVHTWSTTGGIANGINASASGAPLAGGAGAVANVSPYYPAGPVGTQAMVGDRGVSMAGWNPYLGGNAWVSNWAGQSKQSEFGGIVSTYTFGGENDDANIVRAYAGTTFETGAARQDTQVFGADWTTRFKSPTGAAEQMSSIGINYTYLSAGMPIGIHSFGLALDFWLFNDKFEAYAEYVGQFGVYTDADRPGLGSSHTGHSAFAMYAGGRLELPLSDVGLSSANTSGEVLFLDVSWWHVSGDDGDVLQDNEDYVSFESVESSMIIEGARYGFDIDTNYWAIKGELGLKTTWGALSVFYGTYRLNERPINDGGVFKERLGNEVDVRLRLFQPIENVEIAFAAAFLFDSNYFDSFVRFNSGTAGRPARAGATEQLFVAEVKIKF